MTVGVTLVMGWWMLGAFAIGVAEGPLLLLIATEINHDGHVIDLILLVLLMALKLLSRRALGGLRKDHLTLHQIVLILIQGKLLLLWLSSGVI